MTNLVDMFLSHVPDRMNAVRAALFQQDMPVGRAPSSHSQKQLRQHRCPLHGIPVRGIGKPGGPGLQGGAPELLDRLENHFHHVSPYPAADVLNDRGGDNTAMADVPDSRRQKNNSPRKSD